MAMTGLERHSACMHGVALMSWEHMQLMALTFTHQLKLSPFPAAKNDYKRYQQSHTATNHTAI